MLSLSHTKKIDALWVLLMLITLLNALIAETAEPSLIITLLIATAVAIKGRVVVDHFMELKSAHPLIRISMQVYFYVIPAMMILVYLFPETIAHWTRL